MFLLFGLSIIIRQCDTVDGSTSFGRKPFGRLTFGALDYGRHNVWPTVGKYLFLLHVESAILSVGQFICRPIYLSANLSVGQFVCRPICLSANLSVDQFVSRSNAVRQNDVELLLIFNTGACTIKHFTRVMKLVGLQLPT
jgi:hypothetical protein